MNPVFVAAAAVLLCALLPLAWVGMRWPPEHGLASLELAGALTTVTIVCLSVGLHSTAFTGLAVITAVMTWLGGLVFARFLDHEP